MAPTSILHDSACFTRYQNRREAEAQLFNQPFIEECGRQPWSTFAQDMPHPISVTELLETQPQIHAVATGH